MADKGINRSADLTKMELVNTVTLPGAQAATNGLGANIFVAPFENTIIDEVTVFAKTNTSVDSLFGHLVKNSALFTSANLITGGTLITDTTSPVDVGDAGGTAAVNKVWTYVLKDQDVNRRLTKGQILSLAYTSDAAGTTGATATALADLIVTIRYRNYMK